MEEMNKEMELEMAPLTEAELSCTSQSPQLQV